MGFALSKMQVTSSAFESGGAIPTRNTGEGEDVSPALGWRDAPDGTQSFVVFCHDPDAPLVTANGGYGFVHWVLYDIPGSVDRLDEGTREHTSGKNDFGKSGYGGPMPPEGHGLHYYFFWVLALDRAPGLKAGLTLSEVLKQVEPHVIGMNRLVGTYQRPQ